MRTRWFLFTFLVFVGCSPPSTKLPHSSVVSASSLHEGWVLDTLTGEPIKGVRVGWVGTNISCVTDDAGHFQLPRRVGFARLSFEGPHILAGTDATTEVLWVWRKTNDPVLADEYLRNRLPMDGDPIDDPDLTPQARRWLANDREQVNAGYGTDGIPVGNVGVLKSGGMPPATVRVYRRGEENNSCQGVVDVIPLEEYVRGVVPHEWIASWHEESLRAGAIAARSYAWGWVLAGGKYDCADVDDTTNSQVSRETRNARADEAVRSTAGVGIFDPREGRLFGRNIRRRIRVSRRSVCDPLCEGEDLFVHGRGMCQWGTQRWATRVIGQDTVETLTSCDVSGPLPVIGRGQTAEWMVRHYFPGLSPTEEVMSGPAISLQQNMTRVDPFTCMEPEIGFGCADFVTGGSSRGVFDLFRGQGVDTDFGMTEDPCLMRSFEAGLPPGPRWRF